MEIVFAAGGVDVGIVGVFLFGALVVSQCTENIAAA